MANMTKKKMSPRTSRKTAVPGRRPPSTGLGPSVCAIYCDREPFMPKTFSTKFWAFWQVQTDEEPKKNRKTNIGGYVRSHTYVRFA